MVPPHPMTSPPSRVRLASRAPFTRPSRTYDRPAGELQLQQVARVLLQKQVRSTKRGNAYRYSLIMSTDASRILQSLEIASDAEVDVRQAIRIVDRALLDLQGETSPDQAERYRELVESREELRALDSGIEATGTELVAIPRTTLELMLAGSSSSRSRKPEKAPGERAAQRMHKRAVASATKASDDFRKSRSWPIGGLLAFVGAVWATREAFGANFSSIGTSVWAGGALTIVSVGALFWAISARSTKLDEERLRRLYEPSTQEFALMSVSHDLSIEELLADRDSMHRDIDFYYRKSRFRREDFTEALWHASGRNNRSSSLLFRQRKSVLSSLFSTVDLRSGLTDASNLAIERYFEMKLVEATFSGPREWLRLVDLSEEAEKS